MTRHRFLLSSIIATMTLSLNAECSAAENGVAPTQPSGDAPRLGPGPVAVTINPSVKHQTIRGWGVSRDWRDAFRRLVPRKLKDQLLDDAVNELGLTRRRFIADIYSQLWEPLNDNADPHHLNWSAFNTAWYDAKVQDQWLPFKQRVEANGDALDFYLSIDIGRRHGIPPWLINDPNEYAEHALAMIQYLKKKHSLTANYIVLQNEPQHGDTHHASAEFHARIIKRLGPRLRALGLPTKIQFCDGLNPQRTWAFIEALKNDTEIWPHVGLLSYHLYGQKDPYRAQILAFAKSKGIPTAQTETMSGNINALYDDLTLGGVSYWEIAFGFCWFDNKPGAYGIFPVHYNMTSYSRHQHYWDFRQVTHYVRPGAVRLGVTSDHAALRPLAFERNGKTTLVLLNNTKPLHARTVTIAKLPVGTYGVCQSVGGQVYEELGVHTVGNDRTLTVGIPANAVLTIYPHPGINQSPTITEWKAIPNYLTVPANKTVLSASATDPELDNLSHAWSITSQPPGANAVLETPNAAKTQATGLVVPGPYVFTVAVSDGQNTISRDVVLNVHPGNQPPFTDNLHNRNPSVMVLPTSRTELCGRALDLEGDPLTYKWTIMKQPAGASARLNDPTAKKRVASNMIVPGDYIFRLEASDPTHAVSRDLQVTVHPGRAGEVRP